MNDQEILHGLAVSQESGNRVVKLLLQSQQAETEIQLRG